MNEKALEIWNDAWGNYDHTSEHAKKRIKSAKDERLTPTKIDKNDFSGYFQFTYVLDFDENMELTNVPLYMTELPDDSITKELIKRGYRKK